MGTPFFYLAKEVLTISILVQSDYIHYVYNSYNGGTSLYSSLPEAKEKVAEHFLSNVAKSVTTQGKTPNEKQIEHLLKEISSGGSIGGPLVEQLNNISFDAGQSKIATGSSVFFDSISNKAPDIPDEAAHLLDEINIALNNIISTMRQANQ